MFKKTVAIMAVLCLSICTIFAADRVSTGTLSTTYGQGGGVKYVTYTMTTDGSGDAVWSTDGLQGKITQWQVIPASGVTNLFDMTLTDIQSIDLFRGDGANLTTATATGFYESDNTNLPISTVGTTTCTLSNAGSTKTLVLKVFYDDRK